MRQRIGPNRNPESKIGRPERPAEELRGLRERRRERDDEADIVSRPIDGTATIPTEQDWGAVGQELLRLGPVNYADGIGEMVTGLPNAREISNEVSQQDGEVPNSFGVSDLFWTWGQFIDHDLDLTHSGNTEFAPIAVPEGDPVFAEDGSILFSRVDPVDESGVTTPRAFENAITSFMDASMVYGSDEETAAALRDGAYLKLGPDGLLPDDGAGGVLAGDVRAAENVALTSMQTLFAREHNRQVDALSEENPDMSEADLFDAARMRVEAQVQAITYNEWLPILVGEDAIARYQGYDPSVNPGISVEFSTAAFRFGHSLLSSEIQRLNEDGSDISAGALALKEAFFNPAIIGENGGIDPILRGLADGVAQELDTQVVEDVRSFLFAPSGETGLDLAAINIQRGRDLGVASYNDLRAAMGLERAEAFGDVTSDDELAGKLEELYGSVDDLDAWIGGLAEDAAGDGMVGELFSAIIVDQFTRIRDGDPFWSQAQGGLSRAETRDLWDTTLADVIAANSDIDGLQSEAFFAYDRIGGTGDADTLSGAEDRDLLLGQEGDDHLSGAGGIDELSGGAGADRLDGGTGDDLLFGGEGADVFVFVEDSGHDVVADFEDGDLMLIDVTDPGADFDLVRVRGEDAVVLSLDADRSITWEDADLRDIENALIFI